MTKALYQNILGANGGIFAFVFQRDLTCFWCARNITGKALEIRIDYQSPGSGHWTLFSCLEHQQGVKDFLLFPKTGGKSTVN